MVKVNFKLSMIINIRWLLEGRKLEGKLREKREEKGGEKRGGDNRWEEIREKKRIE